MHHPCVKTAVGVRVGDSLGGATAEADVLVLAVCAAFKPAISFINESLAR